MARKCIVCGTEYSYCRSCPKDAKKETWYALYDNENCKNISQALTDYNFNKITKEKAKEILSKCDMAVKLSDYYKNTLDVVMAKPKRGLRAKANIIDEVATEVEPIEEVKDETQEELSGVVVTE